MHDGAARDTSQDIDRSELLGTFQNIQSLNSEVADLLATLSTASAKADMFESFKPEMLIRPLPGRYTWNLRIRASHIPGDNGR